MFSSDLVQAYRKGFKKLFCLKCMETTLHMPVYIRNDKGGPIYHDFRWVKMKRRFKCTECGRIHK